MPPVHQPTWDLDSYIAARGLTIQPPAQHGHSNLPAPSKSSHGRIPPSITSSLIRNDNITPEGVKFTQTPGESITQGKLDTRKAGSPEACANSEECREGTQRSTGGGDSENTNITRPLDQEASYEQDSQGSMDWSPSRLSYVTDDTTGANPVNREGSPLLQEALDEGSAFLQQGGRSTRAPKISQGGTGLLSASNENHVGSLANGPPTSRCPAVIPITSSKHSRRQRSSPPMDPGMRSEENIPITSASSIDTEHISKHLPSGPSSTSGDDFCGSEVTKWTRGAFFIGRSAPVKIDEGIEVLLRARTNGEVDFVI